MSRTILFSPVGGTDPISNYNCRDGALLHICRVYRPTDVYMYMSAEILAYEENDCRYSYCLDALRDKLGISMQYYKIRRPDLREVQDFDFFYNDFRKILASIFQEMEADDQLLINVSSGTPAMKSGLLVLMTLGEYRGKIIQVATPAKKMNEHRHEGYDVKTLWELNEDNEDGFENRCKEVQCPTLSLIKQEEIIKKHVHSMDYHAAIDAAEMIRDTFAQMDSKEKAKSERVVKMLKMAYARQILDFKTFDALSKEFGVNLLPIREGGKRKYFEYALIVQMKAQKKEYADFLRALTPLLVGLFELILKECFGISIGDYTIQSKGVRKWDVNGKLKDTELLSLLTAEYSNFKGGPIYSDHLKALIVGQNNCDSNLADTVNVLRSVEEKVRNLAAHEMVCISEEEIEKKTGYKPEVILKKLKKLFAYAKISVSAADWDSYQNMNTWIISNMEVDNKNE